MPDKWIEKHLSKIWFIAMVIILSSFFSLAMHHPDETINRIKNIEAEVGYQQTRINLLEAEVHSYHK